LPPLIRLDTEFHIAIYRLSGNPCFEEILQPHWPHLHRAMAAVLALPDYRSRAWAEHTEIATRILAGDALDAERLAREHALFAGLITQERMSAMAVSAKA
jgi:DNA-binding FadR family transcriptional regulator